MGSPLFHVGAQAMCPHGGQVLDRAGQPARHASAASRSATMGDTFLVAGCAVHGAARQAAAVREGAVARARHARQVGGQPAILQTSSGLCQSAEQIPGGPPSVVVTQMRVTGT